LRIIDAAVDDRGLLVRYAPASIGRELTSCLGRGSSMDLAIDRTHLLRLVRRSRLSSACPDCLLGTLTLLIIEDDSSLVVHDMTSPNEVDSRGHRCRSSPFIEYAQVCGSVVDRGIGM
jgi:hypothetical protein